MSRDTRPRRRSQMRRSELYHFEQATSHQLHAEPVKRPLAWSVAQIAAVILGALMLSLLVFFFADTRFYVRDFQLVGNALLSHDDLAGTVAVRGWSIFYISPRQLEATIGAIPAVEKVRVSCGLPDRVVVRVTERQPAAVWEAPSGRRYLVDDAGLVIQLAEQLDDLILITNRDGANLKPGDKLNPAIVATALGLQPLLDGVRVFQYSRAYGVSIMDNRGCRIDFGLGGELPVKVANLKALYLKLQSAPPACLDYIDVQYESRLSYGCEH